MRGKHLPVENLPLWGTQGRGHLKTTCGILDTGPSFQSLNYGCWFKETFVS